MQTNSTAREIAREAQKYGKPEVAIRAIAEDRSISQWRNDLALAGGATSTRLGMSQRELRDYSLIRAINVAHSLSDPNKARGSLEAEIGFELTRKHSRDPKLYTVQIPVDVLADRLARRDLNTVQASAGGYLVGTEITGYVELARARSVVLSLGATPIDGLVGNVTIPRATGAVTVSARGSEATATTESTPSYGQIALTPKDLAGYIELSDRFVKQTSPGAETFVADEMVKELGKVVDVYALQGTGTSGQPLGVANTPGIGTVTGTSLALAGVLEFQTDTANRLGETGAYVTTPAIAALLAARQKATGTSTFLWEGGLREGVLGGVRAVSTGNMPTGGLLFGTWEHAVVASWGSLEITVDPFAGFKAGIRGMCVALPIDIAVRDPGAFSFAAAVT